MVHTLNSSLRKWIFLRGLGRHSGHWGPFLDQFKKDFPQDEFELLDLRGNGTLAHSPSWLNIEDNVRDLRARSRWIHDGQSVYIMSISLGAMIATEWARKYPEEIEGIVLMNTSDRGTASFFERMRLRNIYRFLPLLLKGVNSPGVEKKILEMTTTMPGLEQWADIFSKMKPTARKNFIKQIIAASRYKFPEHKPKTEVLILCGDKDPLVNPVCSKRIAKMWTLTPHCHPTAGHDLTLQEPDWVSEQLKNWLEI